MSEAPTEMRKVVVRIEQRKDKVSVSVVAEGKNGNRKEYNRDHKTFMEALAATAVMLVQGADAGREQAVHLAIRSAAEAGASNEHERTGTQL